MVSLTQMRKHVIKNSKSVITALISNLLVSLLKFIGYSISKSPSMLSEAIHSLADTTNQFFLLIGERTSSLESTKQHPWGKGAFQYIFNFISAIGIFLIGCGVSVWHSFNSLMNPSPAPALFAFSISILILLISFIVEGYSLFVAYSEIKQQQGDLSIIEFIKSDKNPTLSAVFLEDSIALGGVTLAFIGQSATFFLGSTTPDAIFGLLIGGLLGVVALFLGKVNITLLLGKSVGDEKEEEIKEYLESFSLIEKVYNLKTEILKPGSVLLTAEVEINGTAIFNEQYMEDQLDKDCDEILEIALNHEEPQKDMRRVLVKVYGRSNRIYGHLIDKIQAQVKSKFPEIVQLTLEIK